MWTQGRLAEEAGVSPTTVSGIESGRISRPHFGTVRKLAWALGVDPKDLLSSARPLGESQGAPSGGTFGERAAGRTAFLSLAWAEGSSEQEFEEGLERATLGGLLALSRELDGEQERLRELYGAARDSTEKRLIKGRIREVAAQHGSVAASIAYHPDLADGAPRRRRRTDAG